MGYYTYFNLNYYGSAEDEEALENFEPSSADFSFPEAIKMLIDDDDDNDWKWYSWETDMKKLASLFPNILFVLHGDGEESDDLWEARFKGSEYEYQEFTIPPFTNPNLQIP